MLLGNGVVCVYQHLLARNFKIKTRLQFMGDKYIGHKIFRQIAGRNNVNTYAKQEDRMKRIVEFALEDGDCMLVEIDEPEQGGLVKASRAEGVIAKAQQTLEKSLDKVQPAAEYLLHQLRKLHDSPSEIQVAFGLKLSAEVGAVLAAASAEANYTVTLTWTKEKQKAARRGKVRK